MGLRVAFNPASNALLVLPFGWSALILHLATICKDCRGCTLLLHGTCSNMYHQRTRPSKPWTHGMCILLMQKSILAFD